jgi:hypothetical protein
MDEHKKSWGAAEHALTGASVGAAGAGQSIALIGLSTGLAMPFVDSRRTRMVGHQSGCKR